jgi:uncharacterized metal-binding protein YceD (DUF177 family)
MFSHKPLIDVTVGVHHGIDLVPKTRLGDEIVVSLPLQAICGVEHPRDCGASGVQGRQPRSEDNTCFVGQDTEVYLDPGIA